MGSGGPGGGRIRLGSGTTYSSQASGHTAKGCWGRAVHRVRLAGLGGRGRAVQNGFSPRPWREPPPGV
eukprot:168184-Pyramimonas_sp.AAC.1